MRSGELRRHLALQSGSLRSAPLASSSVASPPSMTALPPFFSRRSLIIDKGSVVSNPPMRERARGLESGGARERGVKAGSSVFAEEFVVLAARRYPRFIAERILPPPRLR